MENYERNDEKLSWRNQAEGVDGDDGFDALFAQSLRDRSSFGADDSQDEDNNDCVTDTSPLSTGRSPKSPKESSGGKSPKSPKEQRKSGNKAVK